MQTDLKLKFVSKASGEEVSTIGHYVCSEYGSVEEVHEGNPVDYVSDEPDVICLVVTADGAVVGRVGADEVEKPNPFDVSATDLGF